MAPSPPRLDVNSPPRGGDEDLPPRITLSLLYSPSLFRMRGPALRALVLPRTPYCSRQPGIWPEKTQHDIYGYVGMKNPRKTGGAAPFAEDRARKPCDSIRLAVY